MIWQCEPDNYLEGIISNKHVINDYFFGWSRFLSIHVRNQEVSILRVFDPFQFRPLWNSCSIFYYTCILYIGYDKYLC